MEENSQAFDFSNFRDFLTIIFKHKYIVVVAFFVCLAGATVFAFRIYPLYEAKSVVLVKHGREFLQRPDAGAGEGASVGYETIISGEISILTSSDLMRQVILTVGLENIYPVLGKLPPRVTPEQAAVKLLENNLRVSSIGGSTLIQVAYTHGNPVTAARVVNALVDAFKDRHLEVFGGKSSGFLEAQENVFQSKLRESEQELAAFKEKNSVFSFEEQKSALLKQHDTLDMSLKTTQNQMSGLEEKIRLIRNSRTSDGVSQEAPSQLSVLLQQHLTTVQQREREALQKYTESSTVVQNLRQEIQALNDSIKKDMDATRGERDKIREEQRRIELRKAEGDLSILKAGAENLKRQLGQVQGEIATLDARGRRLQDLKREATQQEESYRNYSRKLEESLIQEDMDRRKMVAISVIEKAVPPALPKKKTLDRNKVMFGGFLGGIAASFGLAFLLELMTHGMTTPTSAEKRLGLSVMVAIAKK